MVIIVSKKISEATINNRQLQPANGADLVVS